MHLRSTLFTLALFILSCNNEVKVKSVVLSEPDSSQQTNPTAMTLTNWIERILETEHPDSSIIAYNFGLFETPEGYSIYLIGSKDFDAEDGDWATGSDFEPKDKYYPLPAKDYKNLKWEQALDKVEQSLREFKKSTTYKQSFLAKAKAVTTGFDDGDLIRLQ